MLIGAADAEVAGQTGRHGSTDGGRPRLPGVRGAVVNFHDVAIERFLPEWPLVPLDLVVDVILFHERQDPGHPADVPALVGGTRPVATRRFVEGRGLAATPWQFLQSA